MPTTSPSTYQAKAVYLLYYLIFPLREGSMCLNAFSLRSVCACAPLLNPLPLRGGSCLLYFLTQKSFSVFARCTSALIYYLWGKVVCVLRLRSVCACWSYLIYYLWGRVVCVKNCQITCWGEAGRTHHFLIAYGSERERECVCLWMVQWCMRVGHWQVSLPQPDKADSSQTAAPAQQNTLTVWSLMGPWACTDVLNAYIYS